MTLTDHIQEDKPIKLCRKPHGYESLVEKQTRFIVTTFQNRNSSVLLRYTAAVNGKGPRRIFIKNDHLRFSKLNGPFNEKPNERFYEREIHRTN